MWYRSIEGEEGNLGNGGHGHNGRRREGCGVRICMEGRVIWREAVEWSEQRGWENVELKPQEKRPLHPRVLAVAVAVHRSDVVPLILSGTTLRHVTVRCTIQWHHKWC